MKRQSIIYILTIFFTCSSFLQNENVIGNFFLQYKGSVSLNTTLFNRASINNKSDINDYDSSTYDRPQFADITANHRIKLKHLSEKNVFSRIGTKLTQLLISKYKDYFKANTNYELLSFAKGDLFRENKNDCAFIVYDKKNQRVTILVYRDMMNKYFELYRDIKIKNGLKPAKCNYSAFGTLDYQISDEIVIQSEYLLKNPLSYLENTALKIVDI